MASSGAVVAMKAAAAAHRSGSSRPGTPRTSSSTRSSSSARSRPPPLAPTAQYSPHLLHGARAASSRGTSHRPSSSQHHHQQQQQQPRRVSSTSPLSSSSKSVLYGAVYLYVTALYLYFACGFAFLNRYLQATATTAPEDDVLAEFRAGGAGEDDPTMRAGPHPLLRHLRGAASLSATGFASEEEEEEEEALDDEDRVASDVAKTGTETREVGPTRAVVVTPLVAWRDDATGAWHPSPSVLNASMATIRQHFFNGEGYFNDGMHGNFKQPTKGTAKRKEVLGVVRITKTGSTSLLSFLSSSPAAQTFDRSLNVDRTLKVDGDRVVPYCFFEPVQLPPQADSGGALMTHASATTRRAKAKQPHLAASGCMCGHRTYARMLSIVMGQLSQSYKGSSDSGGPALSRGQPPPSSVELSMSIVTMIRDPYDRMLSFFRYFRQIYPDWAPMYRAQPQVLRTLVEGDYPAFLRELALLDDHEWTRRYQYEYFGHDVQEAIQVVREVRVLPLLNECFNVSMVLLAHQYPDLFPSDQPAATRRFLGSTKSHARQTGAKAPVLHPDLRAMKDMDVAATKALARDTWLRDEYRFYDESKNVLGRILQEAADLPGSIVDRTEVQQCLDRIGLPSKLAWAVA